MKKTTLLSIPFVALSLFMLNACSGKGESHRPYHGSSHELKKEGHQDEVAPGGRTPSKLLKVGEAENIGKIVTQLHGKRVVYVGEIHDRYSHHLAQLEVIQNLHRGNPSLAIGMEMFQRPAQTHLDQFVSGEISEREMLLATEWHKRWKYDYRLYRPILQFAREKGIPLVALNVSEELRQRVSDVGISGLEAGEREQVPAEIDYSDKMYEARLQEVFERHGSSMGREFERFVEVQLLWDETMAESAARYLEQNPERQLVVLAGGGHLMYGSGIPQRVFRRIVVDSSIILPGGDRGIEPGVADYLIYPEAAELPKSGLMGLLLETTGEGVEVSEALEDGAAAKAGVKKGDRILKIDDIDINTFPELKITMMDKKPGDGVRLEILRTHLLLDDEVISLEFALGE
jgi:uncharacterized iron-regulated protein